MRPASVDVFLGTAVLLIAIGLGLSACAQQPLRAHMRSETYVRYLVQICLPKAEFVEPRHVERHSFGDLMALPYGSTTGGLEVYQANMTEFDPPTRALIVLVRNGEQERYYTFFSKAGPAPSQATWSAWARADAASSANPVGDYFGDYRGSQNDIPVEALPSFRYRLMTTDDTDWIVERRLHGDKVDLPSCKETAGP